MSFSESAAVSIVPLMSRVVLCAAFVFVGWNKCFEDATFTAKEAETLSGMGVDVRQVPPTDEDQGIIPAAWRQEQAPQEPPPPSEPDPDQPDEPEPQEPPRTGTLKPRLPPGQPPSSPQSPPAGQEPAQTPPEQEQPPIPVPEVTEPPVRLEPSELQPPDEAGQFHALGMHKITIMLHDHRWTSPYWLPKRLATVAAITEFAGAVMLLIGLFSRLWGLGLAITMAVAFYLTSLDAALAMSPFELVADEVTFNRIVTQVALFTLAMGIFFTGAGGLSLDRAIFRRGGNEIILDNAF